MSSTQFGVDPSDREQVLLDDLRAEVRELREQVERQNELLEEVAETRQEALDDA